MREEERDVEPGDEIEKENTRDESVLRRDQIKNEGADAGHRLAQGEPVLAKQLGLEKEIFRAFAAERFRQNADHQHGVIAGVATGRELGAGDVKGHHHPHPKPEERSDNSELAEEKNPIQSLRALSEHFIEWERGSICERNVVAPA